MSAAAACIKVQNESVFKTVASSRHISVGSCATRYRTESFSTGSENMAKPDSKGLDAGQRADPRTASSGPVADDAQSCTGQDEVVLRPRPDGLHLTSSAGFRYWIDEVLWGHGYPAVQLFEEVAVDEGGTKTGGPKFTSPGQAIRDPSVLGNQHPDKWELLWTKSTFALKVARSLRPGQCVSVIVGLNSLTMKKRMLQTLKAAYGPEAAAQITPVSFALPEELQQWKAYIAYAARMQASKGQKQSGTENGKSEIQGAFEESRGGGQEASQRGQHSPLWILKTGQDAGKGLLLLPAQQAVHVASQHYTANKQHPDTDARSKYQPQIAQLYMARPMLLEGRKFHLRLWLVVTQHQPIQAYLHTCGLVLFSSERYVEAQPWSNNEVATQQLPSPGKASSQPGTVSPDKSIHQSDDGRHRSKPVPTLESFVTPLEQNLQQGLQNLSIQDPAEGTNQSLNRSSKTANAQSQSDMQIPITGEDSSSSQNFSIEASQKQPKSGQSNLRQYAHIAPGHITNLACNSSGMVWSLDQLQERMGKADYSQLWQAMLRSLRLCLMAAQAPMHEAHNWLRPPFPEYGFQLLGADFMVDENLRPWLLEFNSSPSIMALHDDPATAQLIYQQKHAMLKDMMGLIRHRLYPPGTKPPAYPQGGPPLGEFVNVFKRAQSHAT